MKKIFTLIAMAMLGLGSASAQNGVVELSWASMEKVTLDNGDITCPDQNNIKFLNADGTENGFVLTPAGGRDQKKQPNMEREYCAGMALNFKNNTDQKLVIPNGVKVYKINFYGWSAGDNWCYINSYGPSSSEWEWVQPSVSNQNDDIIANAKYPLDPCVVSDSYHSNDAYATQYPNGDRVYHNAGYCFASMDFSDEPYEGEFWFRFGGNNQERAWIVVYTTAEAAAAAPSAEPVGQDKSQSQTIFIDAENQRQADLIANTIELSWDTMVKNEDGTNAADQTNTTFWLDEQAGTTTGFILTREDGTARTQAQTEREHCTKVLNAQNNKVQKLIIPEGKQVYRINFYGWSQGDNWTYLYAYGPSSSDWEWTDPIGSGIQDNRTIIEQAAYPLDPCVVNEANAKDGYSPTYHNAGYCFASLDFNTDIDADGIADPIEGEFCFVFNGNNQERYWMVVYTSPEAAATAPAPEAVTIGKENSQTIYIDAYEAGVMPVFTNAITTNDAVYNMAGQKVSTGYRGLVIQNGRKYVVR